MKKLFSFASLLCIMLFASCNSDVDDFDASVSGDKITISVGMPGADTRVSTADLLNMTWESGDMIFLMGYDANSAYKGRVLCTDISINDSGNSAKFVVDKSQVDDLVNNHNVTKFRVYYNNKDEGKVTFDKNGSVYVPNDAYKNQELRDADHTEHLKKYLILASDFIAKDQINRGVVLKPQNSVLRVNIKDLPETAYAKVNKFGMLDLYINGVNAAYAVPANWRDKYTITPNQNNYYYMMFDPSVVLPAGGKFKLEADTRVAEVTSPNGKTYKAGKIYTVTIGTTEGKWGFIGEPGGSEGGGNEGGGNDGKPVDPSVEAWANKTLWVEGLNVPTKDNWKKPTTKSGNEIFPWEPGQGWYHCIKVNPSSDHYCWAAASANMIYWWMDRNKENIAKYGKYNGPSVYNSCLDCEVFQYFKDHFTNNGLQIYYAMDWFFKGWHINDNAKSHENAIYITKEDGSQILKWAEHKGFFKDVVPENKVYHVGSAGTFNDDIKYMLTNKGIMGIGMSYGLGGGGAHAMTIYGASFDDNGNVSVIYMVDNDKNVRGDGNTDPALAEPLMAEYKVYTDGNGVSWIWNSSMTGQHIIYSTVTITSNEAEWNAYFAKQNK